MVMVKIPPMEKLSQKANAHTEIKVTFNKRGTGKTTIYIKRSLLDEIGWDYEKKVDIYIDDQEPTKWEIVPTTELSSYQLKQHLFGKAQTLVYSKLEFVFPYKLEIDNQDRKMKRVHFTANPEKITINY